MSLVCTDPVYTDHDKRLLLSALERHGDNPEWFATLVRQALPRSQSAEQAIVLAERALEQMPRPVNYAADVAPSAAVAKPTPQPLQSQQPDVGAMLRELLGDNPIATLGKMLGAMLHSAFVAWQESRQKAVAPTSQPEKGNYDVSAEMLKRQSPEPFAKQADTPPAPSPVAPTPPPAASKPEVRPEPQPTAERKPDASAGKPVPATDDGVEDTSQDDPAEQAELVAEILQAIFGDDAGSMLDESMNAKVEYQFDEGCATVHYAWDALRHPRWPKGSPNGKGGKFMAADKGTLDNTKTKIKQALRGAKSPEKVQELAAQLKVLSVRQLHELKKQYGLKASGKVKADLVAKLAERLHKGRREDEEEKPEVKGEEGKAEEKFYTPADVAKMMKVSPRTVAMMMSKGALPNKDGKILASDVGSEDDLRKKWLAITAEGDKKNAAAINDFKKMHEGTPTKKANVEKPTAEPKKAEPAKSPVTVPVATVPVEKEQESDDAESPHTQNLEDYLGDEYQKLPKKLREKAMRAAARGQQRPSEVLAAEDEMKQRHRAAIVAALAAGKTVPPEVLKDYPDLTTPAEKPKEAEKGAANDKKIDRAEFQRRIDAIQIGTGISQKDYNAKEAELLQQMDPWERTQLEHKALGWGEQPREPKEPRKPFAGRHDDGRLKELSPTEAAEYKTSMAEYKKAKKAYSAAMGNWESKWGKNAHKQEVAAALAAGKNVSPEVLADYPDLAPPSAPAPQPQAKDAGKANPWSQHATTDAEKDVAAALGSMGVSPADAKGGSLAPEQFKKLRDNLKASGKGHSLEQTLDAVESLIGKAAPQSPEEPQAEDTPATEAAQQQQGAPDFAALGEQAVQSQILTNHGTPDQPHYEATISHGKERKTYKGASAEEVLRQAHADGVDPATVAAGVQVAQTPGKKQFTQQEMIDAWHSKVGKPGAASGGSGSMQSAVYSDPEPPKEKVRAAADKLKALLGDKDGQQTLHELRDQMPELSRQEFDEAAKQLWRDGTHNLVSVNDPWNMTSEELVKSVPGVGETLAYIEPKEGAPKPTPPAHR